MLILLVHSLKDIHLLLKINISIRNLSPSYYFKSVLCFHSSHTWMRVCHVFNWWLSPEWNEGSVRQGWGRRPHILAAQWWFIRWMNDKEVKLKFKWAKWVFPHQEAIIPSPLIVKIAFASFFFFLGEGIAFRYSNSKIIKYYFLWKKIKLGIIAPLLSYSGVDHSRQ